MKNNEIPALEIFNIKIFGDDALDFLSWSQETQKTWIKNMTNQKNDDVIYEFLSNPKLSKKSACLGCGELNNKIIIHGDNISKGNAKEDATSSESVLARESSGGDSYERPKKAKRTKNK